MVHLEISQIFVEYCYLMLVIIDGLPECMLCNEEFTCLNYVIMHCTAQEVQFPHSPDSVAGVRWEGRWWMEG